MDIVLPPFMPIPHTELRKNLDKSRASNDNASDRSSLYSDDEVFNSANEYELSDYNSECAELEVDPY